MMNKSTLYVSTYIDINFISDADNQLHRKDNITIGKITCMQTYIIMYLMDFKTYVRTYSMHVPYIHTGVCSSF